MYHACRGGYHSTKYNKLKADRPHPCNCPQMPTDYRHTDKHLRLVMGVNALTDGQTDAIKYIISQLRNR